MTDRLVVITLVLSSTACGTKPPNTKPIPIGILASLTGDLAEYGRDVHNGTLLAINEITSQGGIRGRSLSLETTDDATRAEEAPFAYSTLLVRGVAAVIGPGHSAAAEAIASQLRTGRTLTISGSTTADKLATLDDGGYYFRTVPGDTIQGIVLASLISDAQVEHLCLAHRTDPYGAGLAETLKKRLTTIDIIEAPYVPDSQDLSEVLAPCEPQVSQSSPGIVFITFEGDGVFLMDDAVKRGWSTRNAKVFLVDGNKAQRIYEALDNRGALEGALGTAPSGPDPSKPGGEQQRDFRLRFSEAYHRTPGVHSETNYDATYLAAIAIAVAGDGASPEEIRDAMALTKVGTKAPAGDWAKIRQIIEEEGQIDFQGASGHADLDPVSGELLPPYYITVWTLRGGQIETVRVETVTQP